MSSSVKMSGALTPMNTSAPFKASPIEPVKLFLLVFSTNHLESLAVPDPL